jgi:hypothetical protein
LSTRWSKANEIDRLKRVVELLPVALHKRIAGIWCDSGASCAYYLMVGADDRQTALLIAELFEEAVRRVPPGCHNGIWVDNAEGDFLLELDLDEGAISMSAPFRSPESQWPAIMPFHAGQIVRREVNHAA